MGKTGQLHVKCSNFTNTTHKNKLKIDSRPKYKTRGASLVAQLVKNPPAMQETPAFLGREGFDSRVGKIHWRRDWLLTPIFLGFPCGSAGKEPTCSMGDLGSIPGLGISPGEGKDYPFQYLA